MRASRLPSGAVVLSFELDEPGIAFLEERLTPAQLEVVRLMLSGRSDAEIAEVRGCSRHTVSSQLQSAYRRMGVNSRSELAALVPDEDEGDGGD